MLHVNVAQVVFENDKSFKENGWADPTSAQSIDWSGRASFEGTVV